MAEPSVTRKVELRNPVQTELVFTTADFGPGPNSRIKQSKYLDGVKRRKIRLSTGGSAKTG